jgi:hypothetical protein
MFKCKYCGIEIENSNNAGAHSRWCNENPNRQRQKVNFIQKCQVCEAEFVGRRRKTCSNKCAHTVSIDTKQILSDKRKQFLKENPNKHPWKRKDKFSSVPCNNVKEYLTQRGIQFVEELTPLENRAFSIDIAFPHIKLGIEINGNQHYDRAGKLKTYYQNRHNLIEQAGWRLIEVHYSQCFSQDAIAQFLNFDIPFDNSGIVESYFEAKQIRDNKKKNFTLPRGQKIKEQTRIKWESRKNEIFYHNMDFSVYGWVSKVAVVLGISSQKINGWMKTYHPEFFENQCFKRKG